jgi:UDP-glucose 4-epimerase
VFVGDIARASVLALGAGSGRIYCLGTGAPTSVNELHRRLVAITGHSTPVNHAPKRTGDVYLTSLDATRARNELGWTPATSLEKGLSLTVDYFRKELGC